MPLFYTQTIDDNTKLAVWHITEPDEFFREKVPLSRSITHPAKQLQHLAGRYLLQHLVPDFPIRLIHIADTKKPYLPEDPYHFSISHCGAYAAAIVSDIKRVGIDVEEPTERILRIMKKFLSEKERQLIVPHSTEQLVRMGTVFWSVKEAMFKWYSHGEIDFIRHLQIQDISFTDTEERKQEGLIEALFTRDNRIGLKLHFKMWEELVLSWVAV